MHKRAPSLPPSAAKQRQRARWSKNAKACRARKKCGVICVTIRVNERMHATLVSPSADLIGDTLIETVIE